MIKGTVVRNVDPGRFLTLQIDLGKTLKLRLKNWERLQKFVKGLPEKDVDRITNQRLVK